MDAFACLETDLKRLKLAGIRESLDDHLRLAQSKSLSHLEFLKGLVAEELANREASNLRRRLKGAKLPMHKRLDDFDFAFQPALEKDRIMNLKECRWVANAENIILAGQSGTGKTHLAISLAYEAVMRGYQVYFTSVADLMDQFKTADVTGRMRQLEQRLYKQDVVVLDELGYLHIDQEQGNRLFRLVSKAYEHFSLILTTNKDFSAWGSIFEDRVQVTALLDRLLHHCTILKITGESFRVKGGREVT